MDATEYKYKARVVKIIDGDTVDFEVDLGFNIKTLIRTRFLGVNTPERGHEDWARATNECDKLLNSVAEKTGTFPYDEQLYVIIKTQKTGKYGRWLAEIDGVTDKLAEIWPYED